MDPCGSRLLTGSDMNEVYIIDDEEDLLFLAEARFQREGYAVKTFGSGRDLLEHLVSGRIEAKLPESGSVFVVLCDFRLPDMNGAEIFAAVRGEKGLRGFALQTGYPEVSLPGENTAGFPVKVFEKPVRMESMIAFVETCFREDLKAGRGPSVA